MKTIKITYWISTSLLSLGFLSSSFLYLSSNPMLQENFTKIGFPLYILPFLGIAKLLGAIGIINPWFPKIREWAYAGYAFVLLGACWVHISTQTPFATVIVFLLLLAVSYYFQGRMRATGKSQD